MFVSLFFFFNDTATTEIYTLPYTTLFRSEPRSWCSESHGVYVPFGRDWIHGGPARMSDANERIRRRSEEHTSELQSRVDLVCRLLLEKKKKKHKIRPRQNGGGKQRRESQE